jgi:alginate O-acetyltransferase complex protein AlgI
MLFTSWVFLFFFLPISLLGYWIASRGGRRTGAAWLIAASLVFYGFFAPGLIILLLCSIAFNYAVSIGVRNFATKPRLQLGLLVLGVTVDLGALFYYKYFFALLSFLEGWHLLEPHGMKAVILPLGISFFTFTQIGYLVDCKAGITKDNKFLDYVLFVTFFPHLIAGPILHNSEMMPQFSDRRIYHLRADNIGAGMTLFIFGMLKKVIVADALSQLNNIGFHSADHLQLLCAWGTALGYSLQLYFDFSGYSDMAIGLALMFNLKFPANFNSPYKARNIIEFWQRWHMTLTRYLTLYLFNPIAMALRRRRMNRGKPMSRRALEQPGAFLTLLAIPTLITMGLAGVWHGAGLQFIVFGLLHGCYLVINHSWRIYGPKSENTSAENHRFSVVAAEVLMTYLSVLIGQVFFRAASVGQAIDLLSGMVGLHGFEHEIAVGKRLITFGNRFGVPHEIFGIALTSSSLPLALQAGYIVVGFFIVWMCPNSQQIMAAADPILGKAPPPATALLRWRPSIPWAATIGIAGVVVLLDLGGTTEFLYFQF